MNKTNREYILETYGEEALKEIDTTEHEGNTLLVYCGDGYWDSKFEILGAIMTDHSLTVNDAFVMLGIDADDLIQNFGLDPGGFHLVDIT